MNDNDILNPLNQSMIENNYYQLVQSSSATTTTTTNNNNNEVKKKKKIESVTSRVNHISNHLLKNKRLTDRGSNEVMIMEISCSNEDSIIRTLTLRDLLLYVNKESSLIDNVLDSDTDRNGMVSYLQHRDLRRLDFHYNDDTGPIVIVRRHAVLIAFDPLRAIIMSDRIILIVPDGADSLLTTLKISINEWAQSMSTKKNEDTRKRSSSVTSVTSDNDEFYIPFESHAYEVIIAKNFALQLSEYDLMNNQIQQLLRHFNYAIVSIQVQETMRLLKNKVMQTIAKIHTLKEVLRELLEEDEELALMNLTRLKEKPSLYNIPLDPNLLATHEEIEILLESYLTDYNSLETKLVYLKTQMQNAEELASLRLDTSRNQLLIADNIISVVSCALAFGSFIGAIFGMNFESEIWSDVQGFNAVTIVTVIGMLIGAICTILYFQHTGVLPSSQSDRISIPKINL